MKRRGHEEVERLYTDEELKKVIGYYLVDYWRRLNVRRYSKVNNAFDF